MVKIPIITAEDYQERFEAFLKVEKPKSFPNDGVGASMNWYCEQRERFWNQMTADGYDLREIDDEWRYVSDPTLKKERRERLAASPMVEGKKPISARDYRDRFQVFLKIETAPNDGGVAYENWFYERRQMFWDEMTAEGFDLREINDDWRYVGNPALQKERRERLAALNNQS